MTPTLDISKLQALPILQTDRLVLKPVQDEYRSFIMQGLSNAEVRHRMKLPALNTDELREEWWKKFEEGRIERKILQWCSFLNDSAEYIGLITIKEIEEKNRRGEIGYSVLPQYWRNGYALEATKKVVNWAFNEANFHSLIAQILPENKASQNIVKKLGFEQEAHFRECHFYEGAYYDLLQFSKINKRI